VIDPVTLECFDCGKITPRCIDCSDTNTCINCKYPYLPGSTGKCDACETGFEMLKSICIKPIGCQNSVPDYTKCTVCFTQYNFVFHEESRLCVCKVGYKLTKVNGSTICLVDCGNGIASIPD
jgi:hypothetical protein